MTPRRTHDGWTWIDQNRSLVSQLPECSAGSPMHKGFTMVELMVAMMVAGIVLTGIFSFASVQRGLASDHGRQVRAEQGLDGAMWSIGKDINQAGLGFARTCSELRIWDGERGRLLNPGAIQAPGAAVLNVVDKITKDPYWVLRDGIQAHWNSASKKSLTGVKKLSSYPDSAADSFDVIRGDGNFVASTGLFHVDTSSWKDGSLRSGSDAVLTLKSVTSSSGTSAVSRLDSSSEKDLAAVQQIFVPGNFVMIMARGNGDASFRAAQQRQCVLLQITGNVSAGGNRETWTLPIADSSKFNSDLPNLLGMSGAAAYYKPTTRNGSIGGTGDWEPGVLDDAVVVPLGLLRWSRYEIDYTQAENPYLVRSDIIGVHRGDGSFSSGSVSYPSCPDKKCPAPKLRLPGLDDKIPRYAIAPMIEDMQVATGCDGYSQAAVDARKAQINDPHSTMMIPGPDAGFDELDKASSANLKVDEAKDFDGRSIDEWLGNAVGETWAPDCVFYGTGQTYAEAWNQMSFGLGGSESAGGVAFRHSPQVIRVSLVARQDGKGVASPGGDRIDELKPLEDRGAIKSFVSGYLTQTRTERFSPPNLRWRDPAIP